MGMSASQARLLFVSSRLHDVEFKSQQIANQKIRLASESEEISNDYAKALNKTQLVVTDPISGVQHQLGYNDIMSPEGQMSGSYSLRDSSGRVVVSDEVKQAFDANKNNLDGFLEACNAYVYSELVEVQNTGFVTNPEYTDMRSKYNNAHNAAGSLRDLADALNDYNGCKKIVDDWKQKKDDFIAGLDEKGMELNDDDRIVAKQTNNNGNLGGKPGITFDISMHKEDDGLLKREDGSSNSGKYKFATNELYAKEEANVEDSLTSEEDSPTGGVASRHAPRVTPSVTTSETTSFTQTTVIRTIDGETGYEKELMDGVRHFRWPDLPLVDDDDGSTDDGDNLTVPTFKDIKDANTTYEEYKNSIAASETNLMGYQTAVERVQDQVKAIPDDDNHWNKYADKDEDTVSKAADSAEELEDRLEKRLKLIPKTVQDPGTHWELQATDETLNEQQIEYYTDLFNQMSESDAVGYSEKALSNPDMLQNFIDSGIWFINKKGSDGKWSQQSISALSMISEVSDKTGIAKAEAEYNAKTAKINRKEKQLDMQLKQLDTEHSALSTEQESLKTLAKDNISKSFNMFS